MLKIQKILNPVPCTLYPPKGFSLIEITITTAIIGVLGLGLWSAWILGIQVTTEKRAEVTATALATEQIESVKALPYDAIGTVGGVPAGAIPQSQTITRNNIPYTVQTEIRAIDDPLDGMAPDDVIPADYKRVTTTVAWAGKFGTTPVTFMTDIAPQGLETDASGGTLVLHVIDANAQAVQGAEVRVKNTRVVPPIDVTVQSDADGSMLLPGAPASHEGYDVTVTKNGYSSDATIRPAVGINPSPIAPPLSLVEGARTDATFSIDRLAQLTIATVDNRGSNDWWRSAWRYRTPITLTNKGKNDAPAGTPVALAIDHAELVTSGKSRTDGNDVRVVFWNGAFFEPLDRIATTAWNGEETRLWFATRKNIAVKANDASYAIYYGNPDAEKPPASPSRIFPPAIGADTVGLWYFDEGVGALARDASPYGLDGQLQFQNLASAWTKGTFGNALSFNGTAPDHVRIAPTDTLNSLTRITIEAWVRPTALGSNKAIASKATNRVGEGSFYLYLYYANACLQVVNIGTLCAPGVQLNGWNHIVGTFDGRFMRVYVNGALAAEQEKTGAIPTEQNIELVFGKTAVNNWDLFKGTIDTIAIHGNARSDFSYGKPTDITAEEESEQRYVAPNSIAGIRVTITGAKIVGHDDNGKPIWKFTATRTSDAQGVIALPAQEWDSYQITVDSAAVGYDISATLPLFPLSLLPATTRTSRVTLVPHKDHTLRVAVRAGQEALDGALVRLVNAETRYDTTFITDETGQTFFTPLKGDTTYDLTVTRVGHTSASTTVHVNGQTYEEITMAQF